MDQEKMMGILEYRKYLLSNLDKYTFTELNKKLDILEKKRNNISKNYDENKLLWEDDLFNISVRVATYKIAIKNKPKYEPVKLKLAKDGMQYTML